MVNVKQCVIDELDILVQRYPVLNVVKGDILNSFLILRNSYSKQGKLLVAGNGGSAADSEHIVGELMKGFKLARKLGNELSDKLKATDSELGSILANSLQGAMPAIALDGHPALSTAFINDCDPLLGFAQQVNGYGVVNDVFFRYLHKWK